MPHGKACICWRGWSDVTGLTGIGIDVSTDNLGVKVCTTIRMPWDEETMESSKHLSFGTVWDAVLPVAATVPEWFRASVPLFQPRNTRRVLPATESGGQVSGAGLVLPEPQIVCGASPAANHCDH